MWSNCTPRVPYASSCDSLQSSQTRLSTPAATGGWRHREWRGNWRGSVREEELHKCGAESSSGKGNEPRGAKEKRELSQQPTRIRKILEGAMRTQSWPTAWNAGKCGDRVVSETEYQVIPHTRLCPVWVCDIEWANGEGRVWVLWQSVLQVGFHF